MEAKVLSMEDKRESNADRETLSVCTCPIKVDMLVSKGDNLRSSSLVEDSKIPTLVIKPPLLSKTLTRASKDAKELLMAVISEMTEVMLVERSANLTSKGESLPA